MLHDLQRHHTLGQKLQRPTGPAWRLWTAGDGDQFRLFFSVEQVLHAGSNLLFAFQRRLQTLLHEPLAEIFYRANADTKGSRRFPILQLGPLLRLVYRQQNIGMANAVSRRLARMSQVFQTLPFLGLQPNHILFHIDPP